MTEVDVKGGCVNGTVGGRMFRRQAGRSLFLSADHSNCEGEMSRLTRVPYDHETKLVMISSALQCFQSTPTDLFH
jgi:hypothetical protein